MKKIWSLKEAKEREVKDIVCDQIWLPISVLSECWWLPTSSTCHPLPEEFLKPAQPVLGQVRELTSQEMLSAKKEGEMKDE